MSDEKSSLLGAIKAGNKSPAFVISNKDDPEGHKKALAETFIEVAKNNKVEINEDLRPGTKEFNLAISNPYGFVTTLIRPSPKDDEEQFEWHDPQLAWLSADGNTATFKCRQAGFSYVLAARICAKSQMINKDYSNLIMSIVRSEAQNKIAYCYEMINSMPPSYRRKIKYETKQSIEFINSDGTCSRIISHAQKPARGHHGDINYDEVEFYNDFKMLYDAGYPSTKKVGGETHIVSTPFDPFGLFCRIVDPKTYYGNSDFSDEFSEYRRFKITWWMIPYYCNDLVRARRECPLMSTKQRVEKFGTKLLIEAYNNSTSEDIFQQEYEATFLQRVALYFKPNDIKACIVRDFEDIVIRDFSLDFTDSVSIQQVEEDEQKFQFGMERILIENKIIPKIYGNPSDPKSIAQLHDAYAQGHIRGPLIGGHDVATAGDSADIQLDEVCFLPNGKVISVPRFLLSIRNWSLPDQQEFVEKQILSKLPVVKYGMDTHGLGMQMGQYLSLKFPSSFESIPMQSKNLDRIFIAFKSCIELKQKCIPPFQEYIRAMNGVRRTTSSSNNAVWSLKRKSGGHCDSAISGGIICAILKENYLDKGGGLFRGSFNSGPDVRHHQSKSKTINAKQSDNVFDSYEVKQIREDSSNASRRATESLDTSLRRSGLLSSRIIKLLE